MELSRDTKRWLGLAAAALLTAGGFALFRGSRPGPGADEPGLRISSGTFSASLDSVLKGEGLDDVTRARFSSALSKKLDLRRLHPSDSYTINYSTWGAVRALFVTKDLSNYRVFPSSTGAYSLFVSPVEVSTASSKAVGAIKSSLWESMSAAGVPPALILDYADVFSWSVDFLTEVRDGDKWALAWEYKTDPAGRVLAQKVTAAYYDGAETGRKDAAASAGGYYGSDGQSLRSLFLRAPLHYRRISSFFTNRRFHPVLKYYRPHQGIDYAAPSGTPVSAVADGTVIFSGWKGGNGNFIVLRHASGYESTYGHLSRYARGVRRGKRVGQGDVIAYVGSTGLSSGPHLDFRVKLNGKPLNFLKIKHRSSGGLSGKARLAAAEAIRQLGD